MPTRGLLTDGRLALRALRRSPLMTGLTIAALALGIGATGAIFTAVHAVLLRPLPYADPDRLVMLWSHHTREQRPQNPISPADFLDFRAQAQGFARIEGMYPFLMSQRVAMSSGMEVAQSALVTPGMLRLLGRAPALGRTFADHETHGVVVLSHAYWQRRLGGDPSVIGRPLALVDLVSAMNAGAALQGTTVIGVMPPDFAFPYRSMLGPSGFSRAHAVDLWLPFPFEGFRFIASGGGYRRDLRLLAGVARLKDGVNVARARADLAAVAQRLERAHPDTNAGWATTVTPLLDQTVGPVRPALLALFAGVALVLLMTCVNVANLRLARAVSRRHDAAVRVALGASRWRLAREALVESVLLAAGGGLLALVVLDAGVRLLLTLAPADVPRLHAITISPAIVLFVVVTSLLAGGLIGLVPGLHAARGTADAMRGMGRGAVGLSGGRRARAALVAVEIALAVVLTTGAGLLLRSFVALLDVDPGFRPENLLTLQMNVGDEYNTNERRLSFYQSLFARLEAVPGVRAVGGTTRLPLGSTNLAVGIDLEGRPLPDGQLPEAEMRRALHDYFRAMDIPVLRGRAFTNQDGPNAPRVAIVNQTLARRLLGTADPIGRRIRLSSDRPGTWLTIVGVAGDIRHEGLEVAPAPEVYIHYQQGPPPVAPFLALRVTGDPAAMGDAIRTAVREVDPDTAVFDVRTMTEVRAASVGQRRFVLLLAGAFGGLALVLAALGVYGVMALVVAERRQEVGLRLALGARPAQVLALMVRQGLGLIGPGLVIGLACAALAASLIASQLYGVGTLDPVTFLGVPLVLLATGVAASLMPARTAMRVDPIDALRRD